MPDYKPLFNSSTGKRVFNAAGAPVFAYVRAGSLSLPISVVCSCYEREVIPGPLAPAGSITITQNLSLARSGYSTFANYTNSTWSAWQYIGTADNGTQWYIRGMITFVQVSYSSGFRVQVQANVARGYLSGGTIYAWDAYMSGPAAFPYLTKTSGIYLPDGDYSVSPNTITAANGYHSLTVTVPATATFVET